MPPNTIEIPLGPDTDTITNGSKSPIISNPKSDIDSSNYYLQIFQASANLLSHVLVGCIVAISLAFAFRNGLPLSATAMHIVLCVIGYQLLMAEAILSLSPDNGWSSKLTLVDRKRAHWILQVVGSLLAIVGSIIKFLDKNTHWTTYHGQFALVAFIFTVVSLVNGVTSLWARELSRFVGIISKITHICFGTIAFIAASIALCYGYDKHSFKDWSTDAIAFTFISFVAIVTFLIIVNPIVTFYRRTKLALK